MSSTNCQNHYDEDNDLNLVSENRDIIDLVHQAIAAAQPLALASDTIIFLETKPAMTVAIPNGDKFLQVLGVLFSEAIAQAPKKSGISVRVLLRGLSVIVAIDDQGKGMEADTVDLISNDFDLVTEPGSPDPTDVTIPGNRICFGQTTLHIRKRASTNDKDITGEASTRVLLAFPRASAFAGPTHSS